MDDSFQDDSNSGSIECSECIAGIFRGKFALRRHWWMIPLAVAMGGAFITAQSFLEVPLYKTYAQIIVSGRTDLPQNDFSAEECNVDVSCLMPNCVDMSLSGYNYSDFGYFADPSCDRENSEVASGV